MICGVLIFFCSDLYMDRTEYRSADQDTSRKRPDQGDRHIIYNGTVNWKKVKDHNVNHAMIKIGSGMNEKRAGRKTVI